MLTSTLAARRIPAQAVGNIEGGIDRDGTQTFEGVHIVVGERFPVARALGPIKIIDLTARIAGGAGDIVGALDADVAAAVADIIAGMVVGLLDRL